MTTPVIATFNTGSSSLKFSLYRAGADQLAGRLLGGKLTGLGANLKVDMDTTSESHERQFVDALSKVDPAPEQLIPELARCLSAAIDGTELIAAGHRIVHGGQSCDGPRLATPELLDALDRLSVFAPDHQPYNLAGVRSLAKQFPGLPQSLSFDTAFHSAQPREARLYALPRELTESGLQRYGFHGLSYAYIAGAMTQTFSDRPHRKTVMAHLGNGASLCAIQDGTSIATSMGLTALSGVPMATRCGDLDPGAVLYLIGSQKMTPDAVSDMLHHKSGLLGVSGISGDVRDLLASLAPEAEEALDVYTYRIAREIGSLTVALNGLEAIVFTGGVGENSQEIRRRVIARLSWMGIELDATLNESGAGIISTQRSEIAVAVIPTNEEEVIAREAFSLCRYAA
ncbi:acetate/propionate family kinase [Hyphomonas sp.]|uniref:acetate/propionate family kinase n=1 Tax=Hyphomonas sp. TaxID=87 RepID=UPI0030F9EBFD